MSKQETTRRGRLRTPNNRTTTGFRISDELWAVLQPLLPAHINTHRFGGGRPRVSDRRCADAIFYVLRTGCQWQALEQTELCAHSTAHDRFQGWVEAGVFLTLWQAGVEQFDEVRGLDWEWLSMDGAMTKAPLGGEKTGPNPTDLGVVAMFVQSHLMRLQALQDDEKHHRGLDRPTSHRARPSCTGDSLALLRPGARLVQLRVL